MAQEGEGGGHLEEHDLGAGLELEPQGEHGAGL